MILTAQNFKKAINAQLVAATDVKRYAPNAEFVFIGADNKHVFFSVVALSTEITKEERNNLNEKTRFQNIGETNNGVYEGKFIIEL